VAYSCVSSFGEAVHASSSARPVNGEEARPLCGLQLRVEFWEKRYTPRPVRVQ
jgi:hypothetical protein